MATSTFERKIEIREPEAIKKLMAIMEKDTPKKPLSDHPYTEAERGEECPVIKAVLIPLKALINECEEDKELIPLLSSFSCEQDADIERFLRERAIEFERLSKARTYLVFDERELSEKPIFELTIYGYISLALKILTVPQETSNHVRKELDGFSAKIHGEQISDFPCYLIGQLSRNSNVPHDSISGEQLIDFAEDIIATSVDAVGGRYMMIECHDDPKLINLYEKNDFDEIARIPDEDRPMVQMIRKIG